MVKLLMESIGYSVRARLNVVVLTGTTLSVREWKPKTKTRSKRRNLHVSLVDDKKKVVR